MKRRRPREFLKFMLGQQKKSFFLAIQMTAKRTQMHCAKDEFPPPTQKEVKDICVLTPRAPPPQRSM
jgi:hypothetical protein